MISVHSRQDAKLALYEMRQTEEFLASEFSKLTVEERSEALDDIHCVGDELEESPEIIERLLVDFEEAVQHEGNAIYDIAVNQNKAFVEDPSFRLRFLRYNMHDVKRSVRQMMKFLENKATYFGEDKVAREITLKDLNDDDTQLLLAGLYHIQKERDQSGRIVLYLMTEMFGRSKVETMIRVAYYIFNNILIPITEVQTKGIVGVYYDVTKQGENFQMPGFTFLLTLMDAVTSFPMRYSALHICLKPKRSSLVLSNTLLRYTLSLTSSRTRTRTRIHYGTGMELQYALRGHGVPTENCPVKIDGGLRKDILNAWFHEHEADIRLTHWATNQPRPHDVLFGKGYRIQNHSGNYRFRSFLLSHRDEYDRAPRSLRPEITARLARALLENGTRFLKRGEGDEWIEVDLEEAAKKAGQLFRTFRKKT
ncbi:unnamed protein product [Cylindrotheca closterium]|uniref:DUF6824 domain-containing protein n=1 Tax=Cylindrotheca closterium TaxID=2856 RepID=A0AAD2CLF5_9STRA|nr:unnamed protein product [Cylindrotheca closterium]